MSFFGKSLKSTSNRQFGNTSNPFKLQPKQRLPSLQRSVSSFISRNAKQKVSDLQKDVVDLAQKITELVKKTNQSRMYAKFLQQDLVQRQLSQHHESLTKKMNALDGLGRKIRVIEVDRTKVLKEDCTQMQWHSKELKEMMQDLSVRVDRMEETMGIYSGKQKHKY